MLFWPKPKFNVSSYFRRQTSLIQKKQTQNQIEDIFCLKDKTNKKSILQVQSTHLKSVKRASQSTSNRGSATLEAALVVPLFLFAMYAVILLSQVMITRDEVSQALTQTGRYMAKELYVTSTVDDQDDQIDKVEKASTNTDINNPNINNLNAKNMVKLKLRFASYIDKHHLYHVVGGGSGIHISQTKETPKYIYLTATFKTKTNIPFYGNFVMTHKEHTVQRIFNGYQYSSEDANDEYVYVAEHGTVYHTNPNCSYISVRVIKANSQSIKGMRQCKKCRKMKRSGDYVTVYGNCIHNSLNCSELKRTVRVVKKDQIGGMPMCSRCRKN